VTRRPTGNGAPASSSSDTFHGSTPGDRSGPADLSDDELLERATSAANGEKFRRLWNGDIGGYDSHSEADMALCTLLAFWTGGDCGRMDRLFRESGLIREKWDELHYGDGRTYGEGTVERALQVTDERYGPSTGGASRDGADGSEAASSVTTEATTEAGDGPPVETTAGRSRAHPLGRNRLLRQRVQEQGARIEALEAALDRRSRGGCDGESSAESPPVDDGETAVSGRQRVQRWLTRGFIGRVSLASAVRTLSDSDRNVVLQTGRESATR